MPRRILRENWGKKWPIKFLPAFLLHRAIGEFWVKKNLKIERLIFVQI